MKKRYARILAATLSAAMVFTSAPTAVFATEVPELSVSEDAVEAEGAVAAQQSDVDAYFPTKLVTTYGSGQLYAVKANETLVAYDAGTAPEGAYTTSSAPTVAISGIANLSIMKVGEKVDVTVTATILGADDKVYTGCKEYVADDKLKKTFSVECIKASLNPTYTVEGLGLPDLSNDELTAQYGTGKAELDESVTDWVISGAPSAAVSTTDAGEKVSAGVKLESVATYDNSKYDVDAVIKKANETDALKDAGFTKFEYNSSTKKITCSAPVKIVEKEIKVSEISWPTAFENNATIEIKTASPKVAKMALNKKVAYADFEASATTTKAEEVYVTVTAKATDNYVFVDDDHMAFITWNNKTQVTNTKAFKTTIVKKTLEANEYAPVVGATSFHYGTTYSEIFDSVATNTYVGFSLKDSENADKAAKVGTYTIDLAAEVLDYETVQFAGGKSKLTVPMTIKVEPAKTTAKMIDDGGTLGTDDVFSYGKKVQTTGTKKDVKAAYSFGTKVDGVLSGGIVETYQWYKNGDKLAATTEDYAIPEDVVGANEYTCKITLKAKDDATDLQKEVLATVCPTGIVEVDPVKVTISNVETAEVTLSKASMVYGDDDDVSANTTITYAASTYKFVSAKAYATDADGKVTPLTNLLKETAADTGNVTLKAIMPKNLDAGKVNVSFEITSALKTDSTKTDVCVANKEVTIGQADLVPITVTTTEKSYPYGTKLSDIKIKNESPYGTLAWSKEEAEYQQFGSQSIDVVFTPSEATKKNYTASSISAYAPSATVKFDQAKLTIAAKDIELVLGEKLPSIKAAQYDITGLAKIDDVDDLKITVELKYANGIESSVSKVGTLEEAVNVTVKVNGTAVGALNKNTILPNYSIDTKDGNLIVKAAAPVAPSVKPTPAPVKQAVAANPKAKVAKKTVKVGKKYTLKVKYASAAAKKNVKKVKWTSSKKSVATVSTKGKVTAKKAGKATIYARVYFKDGSMKKIKFTVTVK